MKILSVILSMVMLSAVVYAAPAPVFTGQQYMNMTDSQRENAVAAYVRMAGSKNIIIRKSPAEYRRLLDASFAKHPDLRKEDFNKVLKVLIIMEYDWDQKGIDKDALARKYLGDAQYAANKKRLGRK